MLKRTILLIAGLAIAALLPGCGSNGVCTMSGTITDLSSLAANGDSVNLYIDSDRDRTNGTAAFYSLIWTGGTGTGSSMNYTIDVSNSVGGTYYLLLYDDSRLPTTVYGYSNTPTTNAYGSPATVFIDCGATWDLSMNTT